MSKGKPPSPLLSFSFHFSCLALCCPVSIFPLFVFSRQNRERVSLGETTAAATVTFGFSSSRACVRACEVEKMEQPVASKYSSQRAPGKEHIPLFPKGFVAIRIIQLVVAIICLGLSAFGIAFLVFAGDCLTLFTVCLPSPPSI